jgi:hypothetical protein
MAAADGVGPTRPLSRIEEAAERRGIARTAESRADVTHNVREFDEARRTGRIGAGEQMLTLGQWLSHWLDHVVGVRVRPRSHAAFATPGRRHLGPGLGKTWLDKLRPEVIGRFHRQLASETVEGADRSVRRRHRPATLDQTHRTLEPALQDAIRRRVLTRNVAALLTRLSLRAATDADREVEPFCRRSRR